MSEEQDARYLAKRTALGLARDPDGKPWWAPGVSDIYYKMHKIGEGSFGRVSEFWQKSVGIAQPKNTRKGYVMKHIAPREPHQSDESRKRQVERYNEASESEIEMLVRIHEADNPTLARLVVGITAIVSIDGYAAFVMPNAGRYTLSRVSMLAENDLENNEMLLDVLGQVMLALVHLAKEGFAHGDLSANNVMISAWDERGAPTCISLLTFKPHFYTAKIIDFGAGQRCDEHGGVEPTVAGVEGHTDILEVVRRYDLANGRPALKLNGFHRDAYAWSAVATTVFSDVFARGIDPIFGLRPKSDEQAPYELKNLVHLMKKTISFDMTERLDRDGVMQHAFMKDWMKHGRSRVFERSQAAGSTGAAGGRATTASGGASTGRAPGTLASDSPQGQGGGGVDHRGHAGGNNAGDGDEGKGGRGLDAPVGPRPPFSPAAAARVATRPAATGAASVGLRREHRE